MIKRKMCVVWCVVMCCAIHCLQAQTSPNRSTEALKDILNAIPSPLEGTLLIKDLGIPYNSVYISDAVKAKNYKTPIKQALNLGICLTNIGYTSLYKEEKATLLNLETYLILANHLNIASLFAGKLWKEKFLKSNNFTSLLKHANTTQDKVTDYFSRIGQGHLPVLFVTSSWLESLYMTSNMATKVSNRRLNDQIGRQKIILDQLLLLLSFFEGLPEIKALIKELNKLQPVYDNVKISYKKITNQKKHDILIEEDEVIAKIDISKNDLKRIFTTVSAIRAKVTAVE